MAAIVELLCDGSKREKVWAVAQTPGPGKDVSEGLYQQCCRSRIRAKLVGTTDRFVWYVRGSVSTFRASAGAACPFGTDVVAGLFAQCMLLGRVSSGRSPGCHLMITAGWGETAYNSRGLCLAWAVVDDVRSRMRQ